MATSYTYHTNLDQLSERERNFVICIDGTWNDPTDAQDKGGGTTNVHRLYQAISRNEADHFPRYFAGVGNEMENSWWGRIMGGAFGFGANLIRDRAYVTLVTNYRPGDRIFLFGFSRGAAIARMLAALINKRGIPERLTVHKDDEDKVVEYEVAGGKIPVKIEMLGVWDTVASFGIPVDIFGINFHEINLFKDFTVAANVKNAYHLVSVDENRDAFCPTLMNTKKGKIHEVWFPGVHADVGGGYDKRGLADISLEYMVGLARKHGLKFHDGSLRELSPSPNGILHAHRDRPLDYKMGPRKIYVQKDGKKAPKLRPLIHQSVVDRMNLDQDYDPVGLSKLNGKYDIVS